MFLIVIKKTISYYNNLCDFDICINCFENYFKMKKIEEINKIK